LTPVCHDVLDIPATIAVSGSTMFRADVVGWGGRVWHWLRCRWSNSGWVRARAVLAGADVIEVAAKIGLRQERRARFDGCADDEERPRVEPAVPAGRGN